MAFQYSPKIVTDGLVLCLDAANTKSLADVPTRNLITWSEDFTNGFWGKSNLSVSGDTITSPIETLTADSLIENSGVLGQHAITKTVTVTSGNTFTYSIYLKPNSRFNSAVWVFDSSYVNGFGGNFNLTANTVTNISQGTGISAGTNQITNVGNGWYRCKITGTITTATTFNVAVYLLNDSGISNYSGDGISNLYVWGAQLELGPVATTYIPTTTVAVSRTPTWTDISRGGNNGVLNTGFTYNYSNGGGLVFNGISTYIQSPFAPLGINATWTISSWFKAGTQTTDNGIICLGYLPVIILQTNGNIRLLWYNGVTYPQILTSGINYGDDTPHNVTATYDGVTVKLYVDSTLKGSNVNNVHAIYNLVRLGIEYNNGNKILNGLIYNGLVYTRALSAAEVLQNYNTTKSRFGL